MAIETTTLGATGSALPTKNVVKVVAKPVVTPLPAEYYSEFISDFAKTRMGKPNAIRALFPMERRPGMISMLAGKPNGSMFPFKNVRFDTADPRDSSRDVTVAVDEAVLAEGLQYSQTEGMPHFVEILTVLQERVHARSRSEGWRVSSTVGSQDAIYKAVRCMFNPGDSVIVEKPCYTGALSILDTVGVEMHDVETDEQGVSTDSLRQLLEQWPAGKPKPKAFYTVPYGSNPTGMTHTLERRLEVLKLAREHNFMILEDDPYYYIYFGSAPRPPSYFTLESQAGDVGRVVRFDSLSKILSAGLRIGFVTGPKPIVDAIDAYTGVSNLQTSSFAQCVVLTVLEAWGYEGFMAHTRNVAEFYRQKRDAFEIALRRHLDGLVEWTTPESGMFVWFKILLNEGEEPDALDIIGKKACDEGVLALPGTPFFSKGGKTGYVRASFSLLEECDIDEALRRLRAVILRERGQL